MRCDAQRADQLRWVASQEWGGGEKEGVPTGKGCSPAGHLLGCRNFAWQWTKFCGKYSQCFCCFCNTKVSLVFVFFKLLFYFRNLQRSRQIPTTKTLPHIYGSCCCLPVARCVAFIYYTCKEKEAGVGREPGTAEETQTETEARTQPKPKTEST